MKNVIILNQDEYERFVQNFYIYVGIRNAGNANALFNKWCKDNNITSPVVSAIPASNSVEGDTALMFETDEEALFFKLKWL